jgi:hypothetical protein
MAQPTPNDVHIDRPLTDFSIMYMADQTNFIAGSALPVKPVTNKSNKYWIFDRNDWLRDDAVKKRAAGEGAPRSGFQLSTDTYDADAWWTAVPMDEMTLANADDGLNLDQACTQLVTQRMLIRREVLFNTSFMGTGIWLTDKVGGTDFTQWDDYASDPQHDIDDGKKTVLQNTGLEPNKLIVSYSTHQALKRHPTIKDQIKYTSSESITAGIIAKFFELDEYYVMKANKATNAEGATGAYGFINGLNALLMYAKGDAGPMMPCAAAIFTWSGLTKTNNLGVAIDQYYDQDTKEDVIRGQFAFAMKVTGKELGYFFSNAVSA